MSEEERKQKQREYYRKYYAEHKGERNEYFRKYRAEKKRKQKEEEKQS